MISSTMETGSISRALPLVLCLVLVSQLPKPIETIAGNNYPQALRRLAGATSSPIDIRTQYQLLDANSLVQSDPALQMANSNLLQSQRAPTGDVARGYYAFEVAPNMEPPSVPKPPFKSIESACVGSDMFAPFTYKDTLCGNLYHGKVPRNPMGQMVDEQAYPFELIKNKTLQFLAKSLPILKEEASSLPRVYKYNNLPPNQLLNPTNIQSPLSHEHLDRLNQRQLDLYPAMAHSELHVAPPFLRRKRSAVMLPNQQQAAAIEVAELTSNATLVVSSAHSPGNSRHLSQRSAEGITMITKEGPRPIAQNVNVNGASARPRAQQQQDDQQRVGQLMAEVRSNSPTSGHQQSQVQVQQLKSHAANQIGSIGQIQPAANTISGQEHAIQLTQTSDGSTTNSNAPAHTNSNLNSNQNSNLRQQQQRSVANNDHQRGGQQSADSTPVVVARNNAGQSQQQQPQQPSASPHRVAPAATAIAQRPANGVRAGSGRDSQAKCSSGSPLMQAVCQAATALIEPPSDSMPIWMQKLKQATVLYNFYESLTNSPPAPTASPLLTFWNSLSSGLGGATGGSASEKYSTSDEANAISDQGVAFKSAAPLTSNQITPKASPPVSPAVSSVTTILNLLNPLFSLFQPSLQRADSSPVASSSSGSANESTASGGPVARNSSRIQTGGLLSNGLKSMANLLITSFSTAYLVDWLTGSNIISPMLTTTSFARRRNPFDRDETFAPASLAAMQSAKQLSPAAIATNRIANGEMPKAPPTPCPSKEELVAPTFARNYQGHWKYIVQIPSEGYFTQTIQKSVCERQKCEFTEGFCHEAPRWVSLLVAEIYYPNSVAPQVQQLSTPTTNELMNERLAFDVNGQPNAGLLNQFMTAASSNSQLQQAAALGAGQHQARSSAAHHHHQQDPLQMIDSSNTFNHHNLNNLFLNSAAELGLDPTNMAQMRNFADAHNYQFVQRYGQQSAGTGQPTSYYSYQQQQSALQNDPMLQQAEARSSNSGDQTPGRQQQQQYAQAVWSQPATQFYARPQQTQQVLSQEQIQQLAMRLIQANPDKSPQELISMIQQRQLTRRKRNSSEGGGDTNRQQMTSVMTAQQQQHQFGHKHDQTLVQIGANQQKVRPHANQQAPHQQTASSSAESLASINELNQLSQQQQAQQTYQLHSQQQVDLTGLSAPAHVSSSQLHHQQTPRTNQADQQLPAAAAVAGQQQFAFSAANQHSQKNHNQAAQTQMDQLAAFSDLNAAGVGQGAGAASEPQVECDGRDARGCYVVRVYYDWFLVNGSCKCWKMGANDPQRSSQSQGSSSSANFIRRIFTAG